jgi:hypothetical protein
MILLISASSVAWITGVSPWLSGRKKVFDDCLTSISPIALAIRDKEK